MTAKPTGRPRGRRNVITKDLRADIMAAYHAEGGRDWLRRYSRRNPDGFAQLLKAVLPSEVHITATMGYAAMPVPVEVRDALPGELALPVLPADDWLSAPAIEGVASTDGRMPVVAVVREGA